MICTNYLRPILENPQDTVEAITDALSVVEYEAIAVTGHSGALVAGALAIRTGKQIILVRKSSDQSHSGYRVEGFQPPREMRYVIVDDCVESGQTVKHIIDTITDTGYGARYSVAALVLYNHHRRYYVKNIDIDGAPVIFCGSCDPGLIEDQPQPGDEPDESNDESGADDDASGDC